MLLFYENTKISVSNKKNMIYTFVLPSDQESEHVLIPKFRNFCAPTYVWKVVLVEKSFLQTYKFDEDYKSDGST